MNAKAVKRPPGGRFTAEDRAASPRTGALRRNAGTPPRNPRPCSQPNSPGAGFGGIYARTGVPKCLSFSRISGVNCTTSSALYEPVGSRKPGLDDIAGFRMICRAAME